MNRTETASNIKKDFFRGKDLITNDTDSEFREIVEGFLYGDVIDRGVLTDVQKALITLTALAASQTVSPLSRYTLSALDMGANPEEIKETLYQCTPYIGIEKVQQALTEVNKAFREANISYTLPKQASVTEETRFEKGLSVQQKIFGAENINMMRDAAPAELKHIQDYLSAYCFGDFYTRGVLDLKMRELITFCAICSLGGCEPQAKAHAGANISVGNTREILIDAITQCLPFIGFPRTLNAITCINQVCPAENKS
ncbi:carboxymuconolactone decarboxylase family protein [Youxingia wuxianensis]|uniref:Carboxymuconolactone decarboxylase family protein n=1 Tax=Youxingia wuxianensis TaxID=2763678 RepID=A0A926IHJ3_9FIRM|nr:carboxymuconolactone decarboxylase family protein [Youxingia wuxianensis]MBC8585195.1 carboxymuconolactone decarboxylase family protein [Youxingia wuxianensis]